MGNFDSNISKPIFIDNLESYLKKLIISSKNIWVENEVYVETYSIISMIVTKFDAEIMENNIIIVDVDKLYYEDKLLIQIISFLATKLIGYDILVEDYINIDETLLHYKNKGEQIISFFSKLSKKNIRFLIFIPEIHKSSIKSFDFHLLRLLSIAEDIKFSIIITSSLSNEKLQRSNNYFDKFLNTFIPIQRKQIPFESIEKEFSSIELELKNLDVTFRFSKELKSIIISLIGGVETLYSQLKREILNLIPHNTEKDINQTIIAICHKISKDIDKTQINNFGQNVYITENKITREPIAEIKLNINFSPNTGLEKTNNKQKNMQKTHDLSGKEKKEFRNALSSAFTNQNEINEMVEIVFNKRLNQIVSPGNIEYQLFELIGWTIANGYLEKFMQGAIDEKPNNYALSEFLKKYNIFVENEEKEQSNYQNSNSDKSIVTEIKKGFDEVHKHLGKQDNKLDSIDTKIDTYHIDIKTSLENKGLQTSEWDDIKDLLHYIHSDILDDFSEGMTELLTQTFDYIDINTEEITGVIDKRYTDLFQELKKSSNSSAKIKFAIPLIKLLDLSGIPISGVTEIILKTVNMRFEGEHKLNSKLKKVFKRK